MKAAIIVSFLAAAALAAPAPSAFIESHPIGSEEWYEQFHRSLSSDSTEDSSALDATKSFVDYKDGGAASENQTHEVAKTSEQAHEVVDHDWFEDPDGTKASKYSSNKGYHNQSHYEKGSHEQAVDLGEELTKVGSEVATEEEEVTESVQLEELKEAAYRFIMEVCPRGECLDA